MNHLGHCPFCSASLPDRNIGGGIWTGSVHAKAANRPMIFKQCGSCGRKLYAALNRVPVSVSSSRIR